MSNFATVSAERLRLSLSIALGILATLTIALGIVGLGALKSFASEVNAVVAEADSIDNRIETTKQKIDLYKRSPDATKLASQVVAQNESYQYQNQAYNDLLAIAKRAGLKITRYSFSDQPVSNISDQATAAPEVISKTSGPNNATPTYITIELDNPVDYRKFLNFLYFVEQNLTKMQIASVSLSAVSGSSKSVNTSAITVEVYIK